MTKKNHCDQWTICFSPVWLCLTFYHCRKYNLLLLLLLLLYIVKWPLLSIKQSTCFRFRMKQDTKMTGLTRLSMKNRKHRNIVTTKFNMINFILEFVCLVIIMIFNEKWATTFYYLVIHNIEHQSSKEDSSKIWKEGSVKDQ